jgi:hypothetical protein
MAILPLGRLSLPYGLDRLTFAGQRKAMTQTSLDDPHYAAFAWARFKRLMGWMVGASLAATVGGLAMLHAMIGPIPFHMAVATALGVFFSVFLAALLMGLVFLSAGSGHDASVRDPFDESNT